MTRTRKQPPQGPSANREVRELKAAIAALAARAEWAGHPTACHFLEVAKAALDELPAPWADPQHAMPPANDV